MNRPLPGDKMPLDVAALQAVIAAQNEPMPFSGVILVQGRSGTLLAAAYGLANRAEGIPNTLNTRFGIASGSKTFTAVAVCQLIERGLLTLDTRLKDCLDIAFPHFDPGITVHHLLTHSAGNPDYFDEEVQDDYAALWNERPMYGMRTSRDFLAMFQDQPMKFRPGERWAYSNAGYIVLGLIVEHLTGMSFPDYVEAHVFKPCGMSDSGYFPLDRLPARTAYGYIHEDGRGWKTNFYAIPLVGGPDGGAFTTAPDMDKFWQALLGYRLLSQPATEKMLMPYWRTKPDDDETHYGYGMWISKEAGTISEYYMLGEDPGAAFLSALCPVTGIQYTVMGNTVPATWAMWNGLAPLVKAA